MVSLLSVPTTFSQFDYSILLRDRLSLAAYILLITTFCACYVFKHYFIRGVFLFLALLLAMYAGRVDWIGLGLILAFASFFYMGLHSKRKMTRGVFLSITLMISLAMLAIKAPGINNMRITPQTLLSADAIPYSMIFSFDKSIIGLFFIWFSALSIANGGQFKPSLKTGLLMGLWAVLVLIPLSMALGFVTVDIKYTNFFFLWFVNNLFFVCIAEEAIFRGLIQKNLTKLLQNLRGGKWVALVVAAALFGLVHYAGGAKYMLLASVASLFYGYAFMKTQKIETSIITHLMVNTVHFLALTYPALRTAF